MSSNKLKAININDYKRLEKAKKFVEENPTVKKTIYLDRIEDRKLQPEEVKDMSYNEAYGLWFDRQITHEVLQASTIRERTVFLDVKHEKLEPGIHQVTVCGKEAYLYFWRAQGYPRGIVVLADNEDANLAAAEVSEAAPWDWSRLMNI